MAETCLFIGKCRSCHRSGASTPRYGLHRSVLPCYVCATTALDILPVGRTCRETCAMCKTLNAAFTEGRTAESDERAERRGS